MYVKKDHSSSFAGGVPGHRSFAMSADMRREQGPLYPCVDRAAMRILARTAHGVGLA